MGTGFQDNGNDIDFVSATPIIEFEDGRTTLNLADHKKDEEGGIELSGSISENTTVTVENIVNNGTPQKKTFDSTGISFALARSLGSVTLGDTTIGSSDGDIQFGDWDKKFGIYPVYGSNYQCVLSSIQPYTWKSYRLKASALTSPVLTLS
jgi:autotransporter translocation and assembly factor TamB